MVKLKKLYFATKHLSHVWFIKEETIYIYIAIAKANRKSLVIKTFKFINHVMKKNIRGTTIFAV